MDRKEIYGQNTNKLFEAILSLNNIEECYDFFEDLCTIKEIKEMSNRFEVACLLNEKKDYIEIQKQTGVSSATISRINKCIQYSKGYNLIFDKLKKSK